MGPRQQINKLHMLINHIILKFGEVSGQRSQHWPREPQLADVAKITRIMNARNTMRIALKYKSIRAAFEALAKYFTEPDNKILQDFRCLLSDVASDS